MKCADGRLGYKDLAPYDAIHVGAGNILLLLTLLNSFRKDPRGLA